MKKQVSKKQKGLILAVIAVIVVGIFLFLRISTKNADAPAGGEIYFNNTYKFSLSIPESITSAGYTVFESDRRVIAFEKKDGTRLFEVHVFTVDEWRQVRTADEILLGETPGYVFTYFSKNEGGLSGSEIEFIRKSFRVGA